MELYHGSNVEVRNPRIIPSDRRLDFGTGFYLTSSYIQAEKWAKLTTARRETGKQVITVYDFDQRALQILNIQIFDKADISWLKYTSSNRTNEFASDDYDIVIGPVANDRTSPVIAAYFSGIYDEEETIKRLLPQRLRDQYAFKTEAALKYLKYRETKLL